MPTDDKEWMRLRSIAKSLIEIKADRAKIADMVSKMKTTLGRLNDEYDKSEDDSVLKSITKMKTTLRRLEQNFASLEAKETKYVDLFKKVYGETIPWKTLDGLVQKVAALPPRGKL
jgi:arginyl-tRNA synthetase